MIITLSSFALMAVGAKEVSDSIGTSQILFFRSLIGLVIVFAIISVVGRETIRTVSIGKHTIRNVAHFIGQYGWFYGIAYIPLAEVFALEFTVPIWAAIIATFLLHEKVNKGRVIAIVLGIAGVLVILRPTIEVIHPAALVVLIGAAGYGLSHTLTRAIVMKDSPLSVIFYMCLIQLPIGFVLSLNEWQTPSGIDWLWLIVIGLTALTAHYAMSKALTHADTMVVIPMDFLRLPLIMLVGLYFYDERLEIMLLLGASLMLLGNYINLRYERKRTNT